MRPGVAADRVAGGGHLLGDFRMPDRVFTDLEERGFEAIIGKRLEHSRRVIRLRSVVEGQHDFVGAQEVVLLEMLEAEPRSTGRIDLNNARHSLIPSLPGIPPIQISRELL